MKGTGKKVVGSGSVPVKTKSLAEENRKLKKKLAQAISKKKTAMEGEKKAKHENSMLRKRLAGLKTKLKDAKIRNEDLQGNLVIAVQKIEHCSKIFEEKRNELIKMSEYLSIGINAIPAKADVKEAAFEGLDSVDVAIRDIPEDWMKTPQKSPSKTAQRYWEPDMN